MKLDPPVNHRGIAAEDPRNAGPIDYFRPRTPTRSSIRAMLAPYYSSKSAIDLEEKVDSVLEKIARGPIRPDPPLSRSLAAVADPVYGLGTHPDIIDDMWRLDDSLPGRCRWVFWGGPALVHPQTGVVFAVGIGTFGLVMRLPADVLNAADPDWLSVAVERKPAAPFEIGEAGPEWRFVGWKAPRALWARAAYDFAGEATP